MSQVSSDYDNACKPGTSRHKEMSAKRDQKLENSLAQSAEHAILDLRVEGSSPKGIELTLKRNQPTLGYRSDKDLTH